MRVFVSSCVAVVLSLTATLSPAAAQSQESPEGPVAVQGAEVEAARHDGAHPFVAIAGNWTGGGVIVLTNDIKENLRCRASHTFAQASSSLSLSIRCSSDNYKIELTSQVVERRGQVTGKWNEASYGVSGTLNGRVAGNRITAMATGDRFTTSLSLTTTGNRQTISMLPERTYVISVQIALNRAAAAPATSRR